MPTTRPRPTNTPTPSRESLRTAIIVSVVIGTLAVCVLVCMLWSRRVRRSAKIGTRQGGCGSDMQNEGRIQRRQREVEDKNLEVGVVREPLPVYRREVGWDEKSVGVGGTDERIVGV
ncbi:hypothetical protein T440DRAFT_46234 [Plenodomus tracheiphilus IPT5]|uniref:Uncharacterized protein n=1 Tax=Plenodomus tracheiphilus IPT5 TaxID=1408161 RepID=A0A6A7BAV8_9PLEO|nr:hypothetical protein T440DRAFT_46234 [Plenodomus tracheiphilus IPT5]